MISLISAAVFFDGIHFFISGTSLRGKIVSIIGERSFQGVFSLMSFTGIVWLSQTYRWAQYVPLWRDIQVLRPSQFSDSRFLTSLSHRSSAINRVKFV
jgi:uncharacterized membrane protein